MKNKLSAAGAALGRVKSEKKSAAARENGTKGGRPAIRRSWRELNSADLIQIDKTDAGMMVTLRIPLVYRYLVPMSRWETAGERTKEEWRQFFAERGREI